MCGRYSLYASPQELEERYRAHFEEEPTYPNYNISPSVLMPIVTNEDPRLIQMVKWGIHPVWLKNKTGIINVRAETLPEKRTLKKLFEEKRCLVPSTGFYEWQKNITEGTKTPYHIRLKDEKIFSLAGVWDDVKDTKGNLTKSFSIITTRSNNKLNKIHNRMPVILNKKEEQKWLEGEILDDEISNLLKPYPDKEIELFEISTKINSPSNDSIEVIKPV